MLSMMLVLVSCDGCSLNPDPFASNATITNIDNGFSAEHASGDSTPK